MSVNPHNIPEGLRALDQWVLWRLETRKGKPTKVPYSAHGGMGKSSDARTWASFDHALSEYQRGNFSGVGICLAPGDGLVGIDLDKCLSEDGVIAPAAAEIIERFRKVAYVEISPSGRGFRLFCLGKAGRCGKGNGDDKWIEVYDHTSPRYLTVTGSLLYGNKTRPQEAQEQLDWLHAKYLHKEPEQRPQPTTTAPASLSDRDILERAESAANGSDFRRLYNGDISVCGGDHSSADLTFCNMLAFWTGRDAGQMDRIFRGCGLMRPKWDKRHHSDGRTYGEGTIGKAIADCREVYEGPKRRAPQTPPPSDPDGTPEQPSTVGNWRDGLIYTKPNRDGETYLKNLPVNALKILTHDSRWKGVLGFDEFQNCAVFLKRPEFAPEYQIDFERGQVVQELDVDRISYWLSERWGINVNPDRVARIVETVAQQHSFHPVREYLEGIQWDGTPRIHDWLSTYMYAKAANADQAEFIALVGKWWLLSAVARIMVPGAKADYVLVLEGHEGIRKSSALRVLAGDWFTDAALDLNNKDAYLQIQGAWIVEIAELDALMRSESSTAKAFFTRATDKFRPPYGRKTVDLARQCVCAGTVNHNDYIKDYTGGRRYWPVWCRKADLPSLERDRDQLWAEAVHCYKAGERYWPEGKRQRQLCRVEQEARQIDDPWESDIVYWLAGRGTATSGDILGMAIGMPRDKWTRGHQTRIGQIMTRLGWERKRGRDDEGRMVTQYVAPKEGVEDV